MSDFKKVSVHGGHSGTFCSHAIDNLADVVQRYIDLGYEWVCLTEHMPTKSLSLIGPEEAQAGFDINTLQQRFASYIAQARQLQAQHKDKIDILVGFETEAYTGYQDEVADLITTYQPDMIVGSVHHVFDILFDGGPDYYARAVQQAGSIEAFVLRLF